MKLPITNKRTIPLLAGTAILVSGYFLSAQEPSEELAVEHANCSFFSPKQSFYAKNGLAAARNKEFEFSRIANDVASRLPALAYKDSGGRPAESNNVIDKHLFDVWRQNNVTPANRTNDFEFIRRVTIDLTGRIPTAARVQAFVADGDPNKRNKLIDELLASSDWVDKWSMFFGDLFKNTLRTTQVVRYADGRNAFHTWIREAMTQNKPYDKIATELLTAQGTNSYEQGNLNWIVGGFVTGGPTQDIWDQMAVNTSETFLGIGHMNCVLCHDGRRHLDTLSLWGKTATRYQGYQMAAFFSQTALTRTRVNANNGTPYYWNVAENVRTSYGLNTTTGNRPSRNPVGTLRVVTPEYPFSAGKPKQGENYRVALAREVISDFQFSRAAVNYIWKEFMTKAFVEPANQFDPARLDPDNPPEAPWTLQPNQPRLLNALAQHFIDNKYDLKSLMRTIVTSDSYQLSSRYSGEWKAVYEDMYARHIPRRMWAEEIHDSITLSTNLPQTYNVAGLGTLTKAMQLPDVVNVGLSQWLDTFYRGNRDTEDRRDEGSTLQALNLMNDSFVMNRTRASGTGSAASLLRQAITNTTDEQLVSMLYLNVLSRYPSEDEKQTAFAALKDGTRQQRAEDLLWALLNKVDFFFNY